MTPSQITHLARVAGYKYKTRYAFGGSDAQPMLFKGSIAELHFGAYKPHTPEGVAQFRELWLALDKTTQGKVVVNFVHENGISLKVALARDFTTWLFTHPEEACQIIFQVTGGEEK